jgi:hypothetical protein
LLQLEVKCQRYSREIGKSVVIPPTTMKSNEGDIAVD